MKDWLKRKNEEGKFLLLRKILAKGYRVVTWPIRLYQTHPIEGLVNSVRVIIMINTGAWERFSFEKSMRQSIFHVCKDNSNSTTRVVKLPKGGNQHGAKFIKELREEGTFDAYRQAIKLATADPYLGPHSPELIEINGRGGYISEYIEGYNLAHLRDMLFDESSMPIEHRNGLINALRALLKDLREYHNKNTKLVGDWALHNLLYSPGKESIFNVDLEGYYTYSEPSLENHLPWIEGGLTDLATFLEMLDSDREEDAQRISTLKVLDEVRKSGESYSGSNFLVGYHSMMLDGKLFRGQRECKQRLSDIPYDFKDKVVVDLGCNSGGMLHALSEQIRHGYGFDFNPKCVNAAQSVKSLNSVTNLEFYNFDLDHDNLEMLPHLTLNKRIDICFLLSVCMWLDRWKSVVAHAVALADNLLFESNGSREQQDEQVALLHSHYEDVDLLNESSPDDFLQSSRRLYLCKNPKTSEGALSS